MKKTQISDDVLDVLRSSATVEGNRIMIHCQLDRKLYEAVNKALVAIGGKWDRKGHAFPDDPTPKLQALLGDGEVVDPKKNGFFPTPPDICQRLIREADLEPDMMVLEPSAGHGHLADAISGVVGQGNIVCFELLPDNADVLRKKGYGVVEANFLDIAPTPQYDRVIMNPPFENLADIDHVRHAYKFLKPGGRLVSVMGAGVDFREDKKAKAFRTFIEENDGWYEPLPEGAFKESGTMVRTVIALVEGPSAVAVPDPEFTGRSSILSVGLSPVPGPGDIVAQETTLSLDLIYPNPDQPRKLFDQKALEELAENIRQYGVLQPLIVTRRGEKFLLIAGERRWRASRIAGRESVPVRIIEADAAMVEELALLENIMRRDLNLIEEARGYQALLDRGYTVETLATKLGFKQPWRVTERTSLLNLAGDYQDAVVKGILSPSQAFELSRVPKEKQSLVFRKIRNGELNSYEKLRAFVTAMVNIEETIALFDVPVMTPDEEAALTSYERMIERCTEVVRKAYDDNDLVILKKVTRSNVQTNLDRLDLIMKGLTKIRKVLTENVMQQTALELSKAA